MRCEHGEIRAKDLRDFTNPLNENINLEPQVIFRDVEELTILLRAIVEGGATSANLNLGCPFPMQTKKGRGAAFIANTAQMEKLPEVLSDYSGVKFSIKMRLGLDHPDEWKGMIEILNSLDLDNIYLHPRVAREKYSGDLHLDSFARFLDESENPVVFNGEIKTPADITRTAETFPEINGIMIARGVLGRPSMAVEYEEGEWSKAERLEKMLAFHEEIFNYYCQHLCGESQILSKIKPFWEYAEEEIGRKAWKAIKKSSDLDKYHNAITTL